MYGEPQYLGFKKGLDPKHQAFFVFGMRPTDVIAWKEQQRMQQAADDHRAREKNKAKLKAAQEGADDDADAAD